LKPSQWCPEALDCADSGWHENGHLDDNLLAVEVCLSAEDLREIDQAFATIDIKGAPLSAALDAAIDR